MAQKSSGVTQPQSVDLPSSRELAALFQEDFVGATGFPARWAAERVQGNRRLPCSWSVPFAVSNNSRGSFTLYWDAELQRYLAGRLGNSAGRPGAWNPAREGHRVAVNTWIRESGAFDGVADFDKALRDPERPTQMLPIYDCGDGLHPSDLGYCKMGDAIDLALFD